MEAIAKHDFNATADDELSFRKNQILKVSPIFTSFSPQAYTGDLTHLLSSVTFSLLTSFCTCLSFALSALSLLFLTFPLFMIIYKMSFCFDKCLSKSWMTHFGWFNYISSYCILLLLISMGSYIFYSLVYSQLECRNCLRHTLFSLFMRDLC